MLGIDIDLGDNHLGSPDIEYDSQTGNYRACACEKDPSGAGYATDKCRMVLGAWDNYGMAMYIGDEVGEKGEITQPGFASTKGVMYFLDSSEQQQGQQGNASSGTKYDMVHGAFAVSDDENADIDYDPANLPPLKSVTIFKSMDAVPYVNSEGSADGKEIQKDISSVVGVNEENAAEVVGSVVDTEQAPLVQDGVTNVEVKAPEADVSSAEEQPEKAATEPGTVPQPVVQQEEEPASGAPDSDALKGQEKELPEGLQSETDNMGVRQEAASGEHKETPVPAVQEEESASAEVVGSVANTEQAALVQDGVTNVEMKAPEKTDVSSTAEQPEKAAAEPETVPQPVVQQEEEPASGTSAGVVSSVADTEQAALVQDGVENVEVKAPEADVSSAAEQPEKAAAELETVPQPVVQPEEEPASGATDSDALKGQEKELPEDDGLVQEEGDLKASGEPGIAQDPVAAPKAEVAHVPEQEGDVTSGDGKSNEEEEQTQQDSPKPQSQQEDGLPGSREEEQDSWSLFGGLFE